MVSWCACISSYFVCIACTAIRFREWHFKGFFWMCLYGLGVCWVLRHEMCCVQCTATEKSLTLERIHAWCTGLSMHLYVCNGISIPQRLLLRLIFIFNDHVCVLNILFIHLFIYRLKLHYRHFHPNSVNHAVSAYWCNTQELCTLYISLECEILIRDICMLNGFNIHT